MRHPLVCVLVFTFTRFRGATAWGCLMLQRQALEARPGGSASAGRALGHGQPSRRPRSAPGEAARTPPGAGEGPAGPRAPASPPGLCAGPPAAVRATAREPAENMCARAERHTESPGSGSDPAGPSLRSLLRVFGNTWGPSVCEGCGESSSGPDRPSQGDGAREPVPLPHEPDWAVGRRVRQHLGVPLGPSSCGSSPGRGSASAGRRPRRVGAGASFT